MISLELENKIEQRLSELEQFTGRNKVDLIREAIIDYLEETEDIDEVNDRLASPGKIWALDELERGDDLAG